MSYNNSCRSGTWCSVDDAELCNGSTYDSDSYCLGSNPSSAANLDEAHQCVPHFCYSREERDSKGTVVNESPLRLQSCAPSKPQRKSNPGFADDLNKTGHRTSAFH